MRSLPQESHADLGLASPIGDNTEDMRPNKSAPVYPVLPAPAGTDPNHSLTK